MGQDTRLWILSTGFGVGLSVVMAAVYLGLQVAADVDLKDRLFVAVLILNALCVACAGSVLAQRVKSLFERDTIAHKDAYRAIFQNPKHWVFAGLFALIVPVGVHLFDILPWTDATLNLALCGFLFAANLNIGFGLVTLATFWRYSATAIERIPLRILNATRPELTELLDIVSFTVTLVGAVCSTALLSILFSQFTLSFGVIVFSGFALAVVICSYVIPLTPLIEKLRKLKATELHQIESEIDALYQSRSADGVDAQQLGMLLTFRMEIRAVHVFPPNGQFSFSTAASVTFLSFLPTLVDYLFQLGGS